PPAPRARYLIVDTAARHPRADQRLVRARIDHAARVASFVQAIGLAGGRAISGEAVEHDVEDQTQLVCSTQSGELGDGLGGGGRQAKRGTGCLEIGDEEGIALGGEDRRDTEAIEAQRRGAAEGFGPVDRRAALPELALAETGRPAPSRIPHRGHRLRGRHAPAHGKGTDGEAEGCTGSRANRKTQTLAMTASGADTVAKLSADINGRRTAIKGH